MCEYIEGGIEVADGEPWGRAFLDEVATARQAMERAETLAAWRKTAPYAGETVDGEDDEQGDTYAWAADVLDAFDELATIQRQIVRGELLEGLDVAEAKFRLGMKARAITSAYHMSNDTLYRRLSSFVEYLDSIGPVQAFSVEEVRSPVGFEAPPKTRAEMLEDAGIMPAPEDLEAMIHGD